MVHAKSSINMKHTKVINCDVHTTNTFIPFILTFLDGENFSIHDLYFSSKQMIAVLPGQLIFSRFFCVWLSMRFHITCSTISIVFISFCQLKTSNKGIFFSCKIAWAGKGRWVWKSWTRWSHWLRFSGYSVKERRVGTRCVLLYLSNP